MADEVVTTGAATIFTLLILHILTIGKGLGAQQEPRWRLPIFLSLQGSRDLVPSHQSQKLHLPAKWGMLLPNLPSFCSLREEATAKASGLEGSPAVEDAR